MHPAQHKMMINFSAIQRLITKFPRTSLSCHYLIIFLLISPNIIWIVLDQQVWPWDQAWYGEVSVQLFYDLIHSPLNWCSAMISAFGTKAPGIAWLGQFFVPVGQLIGSINVGLLLSIVVTQFITILLIYHIIFELTHNHIISIICCLFMSSAPLAVGLTHQYFTEPIQTLSITWIILIMVFAPSWKTDKIILNLLSSVSLAMISKITSPLYVVIPILVIFYHIYNSFENKNTNIEARLNIFKIQPLHIVAFILIISSFLWYINNIKSILSFAVLASSSEASLLYGYKSDFLTKIQFWVSASQKSFFTPISLVFIAALTIYIFIRKLTVLKKVSNSLKQSYLFSYCVVSAISICLVLIVFSFQVNQETRYLMPILPHFAIILSWLLTQVNQKPIMYFMMLVFTLQLLVVHGQALGITQVNSNLSNWLYPIDVSNNYNQLLNKIVDATCNTNERYRYNVIGLELPWFNANSVSYLSAQQMLERNFRCYYTSLGYAEKDIERSWKRLFDLNVNYFVTLQPDLHPKPANPLNMVSLPILDRIEKSPQFKLHSSVDIHPVLLYRQASY